MSIVPGMLVVVVIVHQCLAFLQRKPRLGEYAIESWVTITSFTSAVSFEISESHADREEYTL